MDGLHLQALVWEARGRHTLDADTVVVRCASHAVVLAEARTGTALAEALCGLARPVSGRVLVNGRDVTGRPPAPERLALVPAGGALLPHLSVSRNIEFSLDPAVPPQARSAHVAGLARQFQVEDVLDRRPHRLSAEQRLRVAVARALGRRPSVLVVEDRHGEVPCGRAVRAATAKHVAVLVITDSAERAGALSAPTYTARPVSPDGQPLPAQHPADSTEEDFHAAGDPAW